MSLGEIIRLIVELVACIGAAFGGAFVGTRQALAGASWTREEPKGGGGRFS